MPETLKKRGALKKGNFFYLLLYSFITNRKFQITYRTLILRFYNNHAALWRQSFYFDEFENSRIVFIDEIQHSF